MSLNGVMAVILRYFSEFRYGAHCVKFTFAISSLGEFLYFTFQSKRNVFRPITVNFKL